MCLRHQSVSNSLPAPETAYLNGTGKFSSLLINSFKDFLCWYDIHCYSGFCLVDLGRLVKPVYLVEIHIVLDYSFNLFSRDIP